MKIDFEAIKREDCREIARRLGLELNRQDKARCFLHAGDKNPSLMVYADGWKCFGCGEHGDAVDLVARYRGVPNGEAAQWIVDTMGTPQPTPPTPKKSSGSDYGKFEREHIYPGGQLKHVVYRKPDGKKDAPWRHLENGKWVGGRPKELFPVPPLYCRRDDLPASIFLVEGEKDADRMEQNHLAAVSLPDGSGSDWYPEYQPYFSGRSVYIIQDNDAPGKKYAQRMAATLQGIAKSVYVLDLTQVWPEIPEHSDVSDLLDHLGDEAGKTEVLRLARNAKEWTPAPDPFLSCFKTLDAFEEEEATWLVPGWIPEGQITLVAADGGVGKTSLWCNLIAGISSGQRCILDPPGHTRTAQKVAFLTTEDSVRKKLKKKLRLAGANMSNIITPDFLADKEGALRGLKFGSGDMERFVRYFKPALCVFDPVQGFVPPDINMGSRNAMRDCMAPLISLGEETGTTFLVICHTNKRKGAWGRDRIADSADLWDVSRSVLMAGYTEDQGVRYLSNEKNNYAELQETVLFTIDGSGQAQAEGTSWKRDREYTQDSAANTSAPKREDCKAWILNALESAGGALPSKDLESNAKSAGYSIKIKGSILAIPERTELGVNLAAAIHLDFCDRLGQPLRDRVLFQPLPNLWDGFIPFRVNVDLAAAIRAGKRMGIQFSSIREGRPSSWYSLGIFIENAPMPVVTKV